MQHYPHDIHTHTHMHNVYRGKAIGGLCRRGCLREADPGMVIADLWPLYPVKGYDGLAEEMLCPPSI